MSRKTVKTPLIYALEPRLLFDGDLGADIASAIVYRDGNNGAATQVETDAEAPAVAPENQRENITFEFHSARTAIVFIDGALEDTQTLIDAVPNSAEVHILNGDSDGFDQISEILEHYDRVDEIHIFGHGAAGEARLGTASLSLETLTTHSDTLAVLKNSLTEDGDILLYGCDIAAGEDGQAFIEELAELTAADIAASDDITGAGGDWELEVSTGPIEANTIKAVHYSKDMALTNVGTGSIPNISGVTKINNLTTAVIDEDMSSPNVSNANSKGTSDPIGRAGADAGEYYDDNKFYVLLEQENMLLNNASTVIGDLPIDDGSQKGVFGQNDNTGYLNNPINQTIGNTSTRVNSYLVFLNYNNKNLGNGDQRRSDRVAQIVFDGEILGIFHATRNTWDNNLFSHSTAQYHYSTGGSYDDAQDPNNLSRNFESTILLTDIDYDNYSSNDYNGAGIAGTHYINNDQVILTNNSNDFMTIGDYQIAGDNRFMQLGASNTNAGDYIRVITEYNGPPTVTSETEVSGSVTELTDGHANENTATLTDTGSFAIADSNGDTVTVSRAFSSTTHSSNSPFGDLAATIANNTTADGTGQINWTYSVDDSALDALDEGESYTETWTITVSDGTASTTQNVTVTINGAADPVIEARDDFASVNEGATVTADILSGVLHTTDTASQDTGDNLSVQSFRTGNVEGQGTSQAVGNALPGTYGSLTLSYNGNYSYTANSAIAGLGDGDTLYDYFNYTAVDSFGNTDTAVLRVTISGQNTAPIVTAQTSVNGTVTEFSNGDPNEDTGAHTITGSFDIADTDSSSFTLSYETSVQWASEISTHNSTQPVGTFTLSDQTVDGTGSIEWTYSIADYLIADKVTANGEVSYLSLDSGESFAETFTITIDDGDGETVTQDVVITVNGANDFDAQDDFAVVAEGGSISVGNDAGQSVGNPITDASSAFDAAFGGDGSVAVEALAFNNDGSKLYLLENNSGRIQQHTLSTQFDVSTASAEYTIYDGVNWSRDLVFNADGTKAFTINPSTDIVYEYNLTTAFDISTMELAFQKAVSDGQGTNVRPKALDFSSDGTKLFYIDQEGQQIIQENLGTAYDTSTASLAAILDISEVQGNGAWGEGFVISPDGRKMFATSEGNHIYEWILHTPNDITSATFIHDRDLSSFGYTLRGLAFSNDGSKLFFANKSSGTSQDVVTFNTSVPFSTFYDEPSHSGDVINTNREETLDTGGNLDVVSIRTGATRGAGTPGTLGTPLLGAYGSLTMHANGSYTYQANNDISNWDAGKVGYDQFNYTINQGDAANGAAHAVLTIKVVAQDDPPTVSQAAVDQTIAELDDASSQDLSRSGTITFADDLDSYLTITGAASASVTAGIGDNFSGSATLPTIPSALQAALEGAFSITDNNDNTASWSLDVADLDLDFLKYDQTIILDYVVTATDDGGQTVTDTITVTLTGTDDKPTSVNVVRDINKNETYTFIASDFEFSDLDGGVFDTLEINGTSTGTLSDDGTPVSENESLFLPADYLSDPDYSLTYTPAPDEVGQNYVSLTFTVYSDQYEEDVYEGTGSDASQEYTFTFNVNNSAPVVSAITATKTENDSSFVTDLTSGQSDPDGDSLSVSGTPTITAVDGNNNSYTLPANTASVSGNNLTVDPTQLNGLDDGESVVITVTYDVSDGTTTTQNTATVTVTGANDAPVVSAITATKTENDSSFVTDLTSGQSDPDGDSLSVSGTPTITAVDGNNNSYTLPANTASVSGNNLTVDPTQLNGLDDGESVVITVTYDVSDGTTTTQNTATVTVTGANDAPINPPTITVRVGEDKATTGISLENSTLIGPPTNTLYTTGYQTGYQTVAPLDMSFSADGQKLFVAGYNAQSDQQIYTYSLTDPWDVDAWTYSSELDLVPPFSSGITGGMEFNDDGTMMFVSEHMTYNTAPGQKVHSFTLSTAYDLSTASHNSSVSIPDTSGSLRFNEPMDGRFSLEFSSDGLFMFILEQHRPNGSGITFEHALKKFTLSTAWDISTANMSNPTVHTFLDSHDSDREAAFTFNKSGTRLFVLDVHPTHSIREYSVSTPYDISNLTLVRERSLSNEWFNNILYDIELSADESKLYLSGHAHDREDVPNQTYGGYIYEFSVNENVISKVVDPEGDTLTVTQIYRGINGANVLSGTTFKDGSSINGSYGVLTAGADGTFRYVANGLSQDQLDAGDTVSEQFNFHVHDGQYTTVVPVTFVVYGANDLPTAADKTITISEDTTHTFAGSEFNFADIDADGSLNSIKITSLPATGTLTLSGSAVNAGDDIAANQIENLVYTPVADENGDPYTSFTFTVNDGTADSASSYTMTIDVTPLNDAPTVATPATDLAIDEAVDASSQVLTSTSNTIVFADDTDTSLTITPEASSTVTASSGVTLSTTLQNALAAAIIVTDNENNTASWHLNADGLDLDFLAVGESITIENVVTATDSDGLSITDTITVTINGTNDVPSPVDSEVTIDEDTEYSFSASDIGFSDIEDGGIFTSFDVLTLPSNGTLTVYRLNQYGAYEASSSLSGNYFENITRAGMENDEIRLRFMPDANESGAAYASFHIRVYDSNGAASPYNHQLSDLGLVTINVTPVNDAPTAADDTINATSGIDEEGNVLNNDSDPDGTTPTVSAIETGSTPGGGTAGTVGSPLTGTYGVLTLYESGGYTYVVDADHPDVLALGANDAPLTETFTYTITDGSQTDTATITVNVSGVNDAPTVDTPAVDPDFNEDVDASAQDLVASGTIIFEDGDNTELSITGAASATVTPSNGVTLSTDLRQALEAAFSITTDGNTATWTLNVQDLDLDFLDVGDSITLEYDVTAEDDVGETVTDTITVTINGTNDVPRFADRKTQSTNGVGSNVVVELPLTISELSDGHEYENNGTLLSGFWEGVWDDGSQLEMSVEFLSTTHSSGEPVVTNYQISNPEHRIIYQKGGGYYSILAGANDSDLDYLAAGESYTDTFRISAGDIHGATATQDFQIIVNGANDAPVLQVERETISETTNNIANDTGTTVTTSVSEFFGRDGALSTINEIISTTEESGGTESQSIVDTVKAAHIAALTDGNASSSETYENGNYPYAQHPDAQFHTYSTTEHNVNFDLDGTYANGSVVVWNRSSGFASSRDRINGTTVELFHSGNSVWTSAALNRTQEDSDAKITVTPPSNIQFDQVRLNFPANSQNLREVQIFGAEVTASGDAGASQTATVAENTTAVLDFTGTDVDTSDTLAYSISGTDADDFTIDINTGALTFTSAPDYEAPTDDGTDNVYNLTVTVSDGIATDSTDVTVTVTDADEPLTANDDTINVTSGTDEIGDVLANDSDPDGTTPIVSAIETGSTPGSGTPGTVGSPLTGTYGSLTLHADGTYTYVVDANNADVLALGAGDAPLTETFTYTITDGSHTDTATITVNVSGVNDAPTQTGISGGISGSSNVLGVTEITDQHSGGWGSENNYTHTTSMYINLVDVDGDTLTVTKAFDSYTVSIFGTNTTTSQDYSRHSSAPYGDLTATIQETTSNDGGEWRVNLAYTVEDSDLDILQHRETVNQNYTISVSDGTASYSTQVEVNLVGEIDIYVEDDFATVNEGASISVNAGETPELADAKFTSANSPLIIDTFYDGHTVPGGYGKFFEGISFNNDGTKMYLSDEARDGNHAARLVHNQYTLSTPYDISTATPDNKRLEGPSDSTRKIGVLEFNNDGTKAFNIEARNNTSMHLNHIVEYNLTSPYDIDTATKVNEKNFDRVIDFAFNQDGTKFFYLSDGWHNNATSPHASRLFQYDLGTPYDLDTATNSVSSDWGSGDVLIVPEATAGISSFELSPDGHKLLLSSGSGENKIFIVHEYLLNTPFDISTASKIGSVEYPAVSDSTNNSPVMMKLSNDGSKVYFLNRSANNTYTNTNYEEVHEYNAQVPFSQIYQVGGHSGDVLNNDRGTNNQIISVSTGSVEGSGDGGTIGQSLDGAYGALTLHADGSYTYVANSDIDGLDENEVVYDQFNYTAEDASGDSDIGVITITINGINANSPPTLETAAVDPSISEAVDASSQDLLASGTITFADDSDTDLTISGAASSVVTTGSGVSIPSTAMQIALEAAISVTDNGDNTATWQLDASSLDLDFLNEGETITLEYAVTAEDDDGETVTDNVTVTITGTNDAPIAIDDTGNVEVGTEFSGNVLTASMGGEDAELDAGDSFQVDRLTGFGTAQVISNTPGSSATAVGTYGTITLGEDGSVTYNADQAAAIALASGQPSVSETFNYRISDTDGETDTGTITFTISGVNDAPAVSDDNGTPDDATDDVLNAATVSTVEDTPHNFGADDFNFTDIDTDDTLASVTITSLPDKGTLTLNGAEVTLDTPIAVADLVNLVYTPVDDENGDGYTSFAYTVSDGELDSPAATMTINVTPDNDAPVAADDTSNILVGSEYIGNVLSAQMGGEDTDQDGVDTLTVQALGDTPIEDNLGASASVVGTYGTLVLGRDGSVTYNADQPAAAALNYGDDAVTDTFTYTVSDGNGGSDTATVTFSVTAPNPGNTPPTAADNTLSIGEDASLTFSRDQFNFNDADGDRLRQVTIVTVPDVGSLMLGNNSVSPGDTITAGQIETLSYSPAGNAHGSDYTNFTFRVNDGEVDSVDAYTMNIDIMPVNDAPTASDNSVTIDEDATKAFTAAEFGFADIDDGDSLHHITIATLPTTGTLTLSGAAVNAGDNIAAADIENLVYAPVADANGAPYADFTFTVNDGTEDSAVAYTMTVNVTPLNDAPKVIDDNGTPDDTSDDVENAASISTPEDVDREIGADDLNFTDIDVDDSLASVTITALPSAGTLLVDGVALTNDNLATLGANITAAQLANNELVFRPEPSNSGVNYADFTFTVSDGEASSAAATMTVDVTPENDAPVVAAITDSKTEDDTAFNTDLLSGQSDPEGDSLSIASPVITAEDNNGNTLTLPEGAASVSGNEVRIDPTLFNGLDDGESAIITVTYDVSDGALSEQNTATITITGVNDAPTISPLTNANSKDDANYRFDLLQGAEDLDGDSVSITGIPEIVFTDKDGNEVPLPAGAATLIDNEVEISPTIFSTLDVGEDVVITVNYDITDGDETVSNSATITISGDNTPPQIIDDNGTLDTSDDIEGVASVRIDEDTPHDFTGDDFNFADENEGDTLAQLTILSLPEKGTLLLGGNPVSAGDAIEASQIGSLTYAPAENDHGDDYASFTYSVNDGTDDSPIGTMAIHVNAVNDLPTSADAHLPLNGQDEVPLSADNFAFADTDDGDLDKVIILTAPTEGTLFLNNQPVQDGDEILANQLGLLSYKPGDNASGENYDAFTFKVNDGEADSATSYTMNIGVNAPPVATPSSVSVTEGRAADGTLDATDPDDTDLTYRITRQPEHGTVRLIDGGPDYIYTPDDHYYGLDSFKFEASDGSLTSDEAEVSLTIAPVNNAPIERLTVGPQVIMVDGKVKPIKLRDFFGDVDAFDPDKPRFQNNVANLYEKGTYPNSAKFDDIPPQGDLTFTVESELPPGLTFNGESISGRPTEPGVYDVVMKATDGLGLSALSSFQIYVGMPITDVTIDPPTQDPQPREDSKPEETAPDLNDHDLPKVLKVNPKRDGSVPTRTEMTAEIISDDNPVSDIGGNAGLSDDGWMDTKVSSEQDVSGNIRVVDLQVKGDEFAVQIADEAVDRAENFKGEMADGSNLPDWVNVDPDTGLTTATPPEGAKPIEMRIIAADSSGNERAIDLVLNPEAVLEVEQDDKPTREERREARQERREVRQAERQARIEAREERRAERAEKRAFREFSRNNSEVSVLSDGRVRFTDGLTAAGEGAMKLMRMVTSPEAVTIEITDEMRGDTTRYEVRRKDGSDVPDWVQVDAATGELVIEATENVSMLELTLIAVDGNNQRSIELEINLDEMNEEGEATEEDLEATDEIEAGNAATDSEPVSSFTPLDDQIDAALTNSNYGQDLQTAMQTRV